MMNNLHQHSLRLRFHKTVLPIKYEQTWYFPLEVFINTTNKSYTLSQWNFLNDFNFKQKYSHSFIRAFIQTSRREYTSLYGLNLFCYFLLLQLSTITGEAFIPPVVHFVIHLNLTLYFFMRFSCIILVYFSLSPLTKILLLVSLWKKKKKKKKIKMQHVLLKTCTGNRAFKEAWGEKASSFVSMLW